MAAVLVFASIDMKNESTTKVFSNAILSMKDFNEVAEDFSRATQFTHGFGKVAEDFNATRSGVSKSQYKHKEAFCLMRYQCRHCGHHEIIWNSRDGVTPFGLTCPSCGGSSLLRSFFGRDRCVPDYKPNPGQRVFVSMTIEMASTYVDNRIASYSEERRREVQHHRKTLIDDMFRNGEAPDVIIYGYTRTQPT